MGGRKDTKRKTGSGQRQGAKVAAATGTSLFKLAYGPFEKQKTRERASSCAIGKNSKFLDERPKEAAKTRRGRKN